MRTKSLGLAMGMAAFLLAACDQPSTAASDAALPALDATAPATDAAKDGPDAQFSDAAALVPDAEAPTPDASESEPGLDGATAGPDAEAAGPDAGEAVLDASAAEPDAETPSPDAAAEPGLDGATARPDAELPGQDAAEAGEDAAAPGMDAATPGGPDAESPRPDAGWVDPGVDLGSGVHVWPSVLVPGGTARIRYQGMLAGDPSVGVRYGFNGWNEVAGPTLTPEVDWAGNTNFYAEQALVAAGAGTWETTLDLPATSRAVHFVLYSDQSGTRAWDNNGGKDFVRENPLPVRGPAAQLQGG
ncbi:MAG: carbohydrate-binding protein [Myxococcales bacterium]